MNDDVKCVTSGCQFAVYYDLTGLCHKCTMLARGFVFDEEKKVYVKAEREKKKGKK